MSINAINGEKIFRELSGKKIPKEGPSAAGAAIGYDTSNNWKWTQEFMKAGLGGTPQGDVRPT